MSNRPTILIVEDEISISNFICSMLSANNYNAIAAKDGKSALEMIASYCPEVIILDLCLPDINGTEIIKSVRKWSQIPIIVVSARHHEKDKVEAFDLGADDYITKPFGSAELLARIRTAIRHANNAASTTLSQDGVFSVHDLTVDFDKRRVWVGNKEVHLTQNEYKIVALLSKHAGRVLTYSFIIKTLWGPHAKCENQILRVNMANIRRKIEENPAEPVYIITEVGVGYRMSDGE